MNKLKKKYNEKPPHQMSFNYDGICFVASIDIFS